MPIGKKLNNFLFKIVLLKKFLIKKKIGEKTETNAGIDGLTSLKIGLFIFD